jgi:hypothetical protein
MVEYVQKGEEISAALTRIVLILVLAALFLLFLVWWL